MRPKFARTTGGNKNTTEDSRFGQFCGKKNKTFKTAWDCHAKFFTSDVKNDALKQILVVKKGVLNVDICDCGIKNPNFLTF